jgi:ribosomal protein S18 acetylase RimI-like enzyme
MIKIESLIPKHASALNELLKVGLRDFPSSFTTDLSDIENRPDQEVEDHLCNLQSSTDFRLGAFFNDSELVGTVRLIRLQGAKQLHAADIVFLLVHRDYQNQGIGQLLMESAVERAKQITGLEHLHLSVCLNAKAAICLYEKVGFVSTGVIKQQIKMGDKYHDLSTMWLPLSDVQQVQYDTRKRT